jgi:hypothetical protein
MRICAGDAAKFYVDMIVWPVPSIGPSMGGVRAGLMVGIVRFLCMFSIFCSCALSLTAPPIIIPSQCSCALPHHDCQMMFLALSRKPTVSPGSRNLKVSKGTMCVPRCLRTLSDALEQSEGQPRKNFVFTFDSMKAWETRPSFPSLCRLVKSKTCQEFHAHTVANKRLYTRLSCSTVMAYFGIKS